SKKRSAPIRPRSFATSEDWLHLLWVAGELQWPTWRVDRARILTTFLFCALLRVSEAVAVRFCDITKDKDNWKISIPKSKADQEGAGASVFLSSQEWFDEALERSRQRPEAVFVLPAANGGKWSPNAAASELRRLCEAARIDGLSPHSFRRGGTMRYLEQGIDFNAVQRRGRWANPKSMTPYIRQSLASQGGPALLIEQ
ncbi:site-specific recombinase, phage integrase family, partial [Oesophagostomum dentatum]